MYSALKNVIHPADEYYPVPWWAWTGNMQKPEMLRQLKLMHDQNIREFFIFPNCGLEYPVFLQESWWEYVDFTICECEKLGMKVWIYDDLSWPSGSAGGLAMQQNPEYRMQLLQCCRIQLAADEVYRQDPALDMIHIEFHSDSGKVLPVTLDDSWTWQNNYAENGTVILIINTVYDEISLNSTAVAWTRHQRGTVDLLNADAVDAWMELIYGEYYRRFSGYFGKTIKGFFCDEPRPNRCNGHSIPWTGKLFQTFREKYGYDLTVRLPEIFIDRGNFAETRRDYWNLITELFNVNFTCRLEKWCRDKNVLLTGHTAPEEMCYQRNMLVSQGDIQQIVRHMDIPGCDLLGAQTPYFADPGAPWYGIGLKAMQNLILTAKRPASSARYTGAKRAMCEAFGVRSWHGDMREQKLINDYLAAAGINFINDNSLTYTVSDYRHTTSGKHFTQPWWKYYHIFNDYSARVSAFAAWGDIDAQVAILFPQTAHQTLTPADIQEPIPPQGELTEAVNRTGNALLKNHVPFEYIWEYVIKEAVVDDGGLKIPGGLLKVLILPQSFIIGEEIFHKLEKFTAAGGKVIAAGSAPAYILPEKGELYPIPENLIFTTVPLTGNDDFDSQLLNVIYEKLPRKWSLCGEETDKVVSCMRKDGNTRMLLVANQLPGNRKLTFSHTFDGDVFLLDPETGKYSDLLQQHNGSCHEVCFGLAENQSFILVINAPEEFKPDTDRKSCFDRNNATRLKLSDSWDFSVEPANHYLVPCQLRLDPFDLGEKQKWYLASPEKDDSFAALWRQVRFGKSPFGLSPEESKFYWLTGSFNLENVPDDLALIVDNADCAALYVNGNPVGTYSAAQLWDQENRSYKCAKFCHRGTNRFFIKVRTSTWFSPSRGVTGYYEFKMVDKYPMLVVVSGSFAVDREHLGSLPEKICSNASWNKQGFSFFSGTGSYRQKFFLTDVPNRAILHISEVRGAVSVTLNQQHIGNRAWGPWEFELSDVLKEGENEIIINVTGSLGNILQRSYGDRWTPPQDYGMTGSATIFLQK